MTDTVDKVLDVVGALVPPSSDADPERTRRWRIALVLFIGTTTMFNLFHVAWACGWLTIIGLTGFAKAEDVTNFTEVVDKRQLSLESAIKDTRVLLVQQALKEALKVRCLSIIQNNQFALDGANTEIQGLEEQYYYLTKRGYAEPSCAVVLIAKVP